MADLTLAAPELALVDHHVPGVLRADLDRTGIEALLTESGTGARRVYRLPPP